MSHVETLTSLMSLGQLITNIESLPVPSLDSVVGFTKFTLLKNYFVY